VPRGEDRRLVEVSREADAGGDLLQRVGEGGIGRRVVGRVAAEDDEGVDLAAVDVDGERLDAHRLVRLVRVGRLVQVNDRAEVREPLVEGVSEGVDARRLARADHDDAAAAVGDELGADLVEPLGVDTFGRLAGGDGPGERAHVDPLAREHLAERQEVALDVTGGEAQAVVRVGARGREVRLHHVEAAHAVGRLVQLARQGEAARVAQHARLRLEEVAVERDDDLRLGEVVDHRDRATEGDAAAFAGVRFADGGVRVEGRLGELRLHRVAEAEEGRADGRLAEEAELRAAVGREGLELVAYGALELLGLGDDALLAVDHADVAGAVGIVELEDRRLAAKVAGAAAARVLGVAFELGRAVLVHLGDEADHVAALGPGGAVVVGDARGRVLDLLVVRHHLLDGAAAGLESGDRGGAGAELEDAAAGDAGAGRGGLGPIVGGHRLAGDDSLETQGELRGRGLLRGLGIGLLREALPERPGAAVQLAGGGVRLTLAHRWHPEQFCGGLTFTAVGSKLGESSGFQVMLVI
jgi:hypothetical protein